MYTPFPLLELHPLLSFVWKTIAISFKSAKYYKPNFINGLPGHRSIAGDEYSLGNTHHQLHVLADYGPDAPIV